jgi:adenylate cyclase
LAEIGLSGADTANHHSFSVREQRGSMSFTGNGDLIPVGGGDTIHLIRPQLTIGRRESCDICLRYANVSGLHAELFFKDGHWFIQDLGSTNGIKVNGVRVQRRTKKVLHPQDVIKIAKLQFTIDYVPAVSSRMDELLEDMEDEDILQQPLLERAGLTKKKNRPGQRRPLDDDDDDDDDDD